MRSSLSGETRLHLPRAGMIKSSYFIAMQLLPDNFEYRVDHSGVQSKIAKFTGVGAGGRRVFHCSQAGGE